MLVQTVVRRFGRAYCHQCRRMDDCVTMSLRCEERNAIVNYVVCRKCVDDGIGVEMRIPNPIADHGLARRRRLSRRGERATAREVGGRQTANSGATRGDGDVLTDKWMIEEKSTGSRSYRVSANVLNRAMEQAEGAKRDWVIRLRMPDGIDLAVLDWRVFRGLEKDNESTDGP